MIVRRPDPLQLYAHGVRNLLDLAVLTHIAECGLNGATAVGTQELIQQTGTASTYETVRSSIRRLLHLKLCIRYSLRHNGTTRGRSSHVYVLTKGGLKLFTLPPTITIAEAPTLEVASPT